MRRITGAFLSVMLVGSGMGTLMGAGIANAWPSRVFVSPSGSSRGADVSCRTAGFSSINRAISKVATHGTVIVCPGTYHTQAVVTRPMSLIGRNAIINAAGQKPVIRKLPGGSGIVVLKTRDVQIMGFRINRAGFDAILVALSTHVLVSHNVLKHNGDVGVDFNGTSFSRASHNVSKFNHGGGFLVADDVGSTEHDIISWNVASHNPGGCGLSSRDTASSASGTTGSRTTGWSRTARCPSPPAPGWSSPPRCPVRRSRATP